MIHYIYADNAVQTAVLVCGVCEPVVKRTDNLHRHSSYLWKMRNCSHPHRQRHGGVQTTWDPGQPRRDFDPAPQPMPATDGLQELVRISVLTELGCGLALLP